MGRGLWTVAFVLLCALVLVPPATAQVFAEPPARDLVVRPGEPTTFTQTFTNPTLRSFFVLGTATGNLSTVVDFDPDRFEVGPESAATVNVTVTPPADTLFESGDLMLRFTVVDRTSGDSFDRMVPITLTVERKPLLLGLVDNPLPPPFHDGWGMFVAEAVAWAVIGFVVSFTGGRLVAAFVRRARKATKDEMATLVHAPIWWLVVALGIDHAWRLVPRTPFVVILDRLNGAVAIVLAGLLLYRLFTAGLLHYRERFAGKTRTNVDDLLIPVLQKTAAAAVIVLVGVFVFQALGADLSFLVAGGLVVGLVVSMAAQDTLSNFFSGIFILIDQPFREGDNLMLETGEICRVDRIGLRSTRLFHFQNSQQIILPNNELATKRVINMTYPDPAYRIVLGVGVAYDSDLRKVKTILEQVAEENTSLLKGERYAPTVYLKEFGDSSINFELRVYVPNARHRNPVGTELRFAMKEAFDREGIVIPFPQRDVWFKNAIEDTPAPKDAA